MVSGKGLIEFNRRLSRSFCLMLKLDKYEHYLPYSEDYFVRRLRETILACRKYFNGETLRVLDIGCGMHSYLITIEDLHHMITPYGMDISGRELNENKFITNRIIHDACDNNYREKLKEYQGSFHMIISHMFLEHVSNPETTHSMINFLLHPNGFALHAYPTFYDPLLWAGNLLPDAIAKKVLFFFEPFRADTGKFKTYYRKCRYCSPSLRRWFAARGFDCVDYREFYGSFYLYAAFPLQWIADLFYWLVMSLRCRIYSARSIVTLQKK
jgi:2-polyprenyl-3-methyl-5-hydroxy-6-metoxy-1,4-benzoquinol methylase